MFWKIFSYYLPFFYSNIFGLTLDQVALLLVVTRIWDAVSDPMMGVLADRTRTKWGKYRPYLLLMAVPFALSGIFLFSTPAASPTVKLVWAYLTYILMMTVYTGINVPYGAMLGVMTDDSNSKTVLSSFRMFFAYGGSFLALFCWEPLCRILGGYDSPAGWRNAMIVVAAFCLLLFLLCFRMTKEKLHTVSKASVGSDLKSLFREAENNRQHLTAHIIFTADTFKKPYSEFERTYEVSSDNKAFQSRMGGYSIYGASLDGVDPCLRMEGLMADEMGGKDGWKIEKCFLIGDSREVADIIHGDFFIARSNVADEKYSSLSSEQLLKYKRLFRYPERFHETAHGIEIEPFKPDRADKER